MSEEREAEPDPLCYACESPCAGDVAGVLWCCVCAAKQEPPLMKSVWEMKLEAARAKAGVGLDPNHPDGDYSRLCGSSFCRCAQ